MALHLCSIMLPPGHPIVGVLSSKRQLLAPFKKIKNKKYYYDVIKESNINAHVIVASIMT
jgi:hypothetical protein